MIAAPDMRRFICTAAQPDRCAARVREQISCVNSKPLPTDVPKRFLGIFRRLAVSLACLLLFEVHLQAQVWNGTSSVNWTTGANWAGGSPPTSTGTATFNAPTPSSPTVNASVAAGQLLFTGTANQNFSGTNTLTLNGVGGVGISNQVNYTPTFANPITLGASQTWQAANAAGGGMTFNGAVSLSANTLTLDPQNAANIVTINSVISGTGALNKTGAGTVVLSGTNSYTGATTINAGTLRATGGNAIGNSSTVTLASVAGATLDLADSNETIGSLAGGGWAMSRLAQELSRLGRPPPPPMPE